MDALTDAQIRKEFLRWLNLVSSLMSACSGYGAAIKGENPLELFTSSVEIGKAVDEIVGAAKQPDRSISDLEQLLRSGSDLGARDGFPSGNDFNQDLSKLNRIDLIASIR